MIVIVMISDCSFAQIVNILYIWKVNTTVYLLD